MKKDWNKNGKKGKLSLYLIKHVMKTYGGVEVQLRALLTLALDGE
jgi:hypothetical protein